VTDCARAYTAPRVGMLTEGRIKAEVEELLRDSAPDNSSRIEAKSRQLYRTMNEAARPELQECERLKSIMRDLYGI
jgi:hypothetical protein